MTKLDGNDKLLKLLKDVAEKNGGLSGLLTDAKTHKTALESELKALGSDTDDSGV